jgi:3-dehydroquinate synthase
MYFDRVRIIKVPLKDRSYEIKIGPAFLGQLGRESARLRIGKRCAVFTDSNVGPRFAADAVGSLNAAGIEPVLVTVKAGEASKSLAQVQACYEQLAGHRIDRNSFVVALGGGVVGDLAGYVAATWLRGIPFVQVPTTLLAQVDSSVGGKTGVNLKAGKNLVGAFHQPRLVLCDLDTLETLPEREYRSGLAEVIKYGIIYDADLFLMLERRMDLLLARDPRTLSKVVAWCCSIKSDVVGQDETESGLRAILNFGHTIGHAIEAVSSYGKFLHGEAISIGQSGAAMVSEKLLGLSRDEVDRIIKLLQRAGLPVHIKLTPQAQRGLLEAMALDKKAAGGQARFVLARAIGKVEYGCPVPSDLLLDTLRVLNKNSDRPRV